MSRCLTGVLFSLLFVLGGCAPRGESKSLDEVLAIAKVRYTQARRTSINDSVAGKLENITGELKDILNTTDTHTLQSRAQKIAGMLAIITSQASYTVRPALGELTSQYRMLAGHSAEQQHYRGATVKLLVARTYTLLAGELETTRFGV